MASTVELGEVYLGTREPARDSRGPTSRRVAPGTRPYLEMCSCKVWLDAGTLRPGACLSRCWYARSRCHGQGQRVRAGEPVRALSRDAQAPPFNVQVVDMEKKRCRGQASSNQA